MGCLFGQPVKVTAAGRTDSGVHATGQVVSLATETGFPLDRLLVALRGLLPTDLSVREVESVEPAFSARFSACERTYVYAVLNRPQPAALLTRYAAHVAFSLELDAMRVAASHLLGEHDFRAFSAAGAADRTIRRLVRLEIERRGEFVRFEVRGDGFLHRMVRTIVGTLLECGSGRRGPGQVPAMLAARSRAAAGATAPPQGLYLAGVRYAGGYDSFAEPPILGGGFSELAGRLTPHRTFP